MKAPNRPFTHNLPRIITIITIKSMWSQLRAPSPSTALVSLLFPMQQVILRK